MKNFRGVGVSQEIGRRSRTNKRRLPTNTSASQSRKSIRKSTVSDAQDVTGFAHYVKNFFANIFGCCGGGGGASNPDPSAHNNSMNSSMQMPDYTFVPVPNGTNSVSQESNNTKQNANNQSVARRSQLIKDFKAGNRQKDASVLDTEKDTVEIDIEGKDIALHNRNSDAESDIVEDENDHVANAQRPIQATRANYLTPGDRIETSNYRADTATNNQ